VVGDHRVDVSRITVDDDGVVGRDLGAGMSRGTASTTALVCLDGLGVARWRSGHRCRTGLCGRQRGRRGRMWMCGGGQCRQGRVR
jgi:hypothetical protein